jgi:FtsP/CotA-like multicopper oxidase with cupredoxin domain
MKIKQVGKDRKSRNLQGITRREFVNQMLVATSGLALTNVLPSFAKPLMAPAACPDTFPKIKEIASKGGRLRAAMTIRNSQKNLPDYAGSQLPVMRYFEGRDLNDGTIWPPADQVQACLPGPTLRAKVGEKVEITFLNHVTPGAFSNSGLSIDNAEQGKGTGCDMYTNAAAPGGPDNKWYPETRGDVFPNCFHSSSTANLHFHGTHVSPDDFADNVLVQVRPDTTYTEQVAAPLFKQVFEYSESAHPIEWDKTPAAWRIDQARRIKNYDDTAIWQGKRGTPGNPALPKENWLSTKNADLRAKGKWPEYFVGGYPYNFEITEAAGHKMGQAPGTHWYHAHKHGSTAIHLYNGLAGALIIEGDYDRDLRAIYPDFDQTQKVIVVQRFTDEMDLERAGNSNTIPVMVNGIRADKSPAAGQNPGVTINMRPGEVQLWRIVNAMVENSLRASFKDSSGAVVPIFRQIAQDGVQFSLANYQNQPLTVQDPTTKNATRLWVTAGGRADILVKAPASGTFSLIDSGFATYVNLVVCGDPVDMDFPNEGRNAGKYPVFPDFLSDVGACRKTRNLDFGWEPYRLVSLPALSGVTHANPSDITQKATLPITIKVKGNDNFVVNVNRAPYFTLDGVQFSEDVYGQTLVLDEPEEWFITNTTSIRHPYHIHVNPFQLVEVFDPNDSSNSYKAEAGGVWHDVILIPAAKTDAGGNLLIGNDGKATQPGYVRIRSRYVDFTGDFVLHCHLLGHEDRGMMQFVRIIPRVSPLQHH